MFKRMFSKIIGKGTVIVNGKTYESNGGIVSVKGDKVYINDKMIEDCSNEKEINLTINGDCKDIESAGNVDIKGNVHGYIEAGGAVTIKGYTTGNIDACNSVVITGDCNGDIEAGNSVTIAGSHTGGSIDAGNSVNIGNKI